MFARNVLHICPGVPRTGSFRKKRGKNGFFLRKLLTVIDLFQDLWSMETRFGVIKIESGMRLSWLTQFGAFSLNQHVINYSENEPKTTRERWKMQQHGLAQGSSSGSTRCTQPSSKASTNTNEPEAGSAMYLSSSPFLSCSLLLTVATQIRGHIVGSSPPSPLRCVP